MGRIIRWIKDIWLGKRYLGQNVERATAVIANGTTALFTITGGRVLVTEIIGLITVVFQGIAITVKLRAVPGGGATAVDLCAARDIQSYAAGDLLDITGIPTDQIEPPTSAGAIVGQTVPVICQTGSISVVAVTAGNTGQVRWTLKYQPIDDSAVVVAA
jgi:hypothetical protein